MYTKHRKADIKLTKSNLGVISLLNVSENQSIDFHSVKHNKTRRFSQIVRAVQKVTKTVNCSVLFQFPHIKTIFVKFLECKANATQLCIDGVKIFYISFLFSTSPQCCVTRPWVNRKPVEEPITLCIILQL